MLSLSEKLLMLLCHNFIYFFEWKIVFYNLIWSFNRDFACRSFFIFVSPSIQLCLRSSSGGGLLFPRKFDSITWQTHIHTQRKTHFEDRLNRLSFIVIVHYFTNLLWANGKYKIHFVFCISAIWRRKKNENLEQKRLRWSMAINGWMTII